MLTYLTEATPILLGLAAAAAWGGADFTGALAARRGRPGSVVFVAHGTSLILLVLLILLIHPAPLSGLGWAWGLLSGASGGFALMLFYEALATGAMGLSAALAGVLTAALPVGVAVVREGRPGGWQVAGFVAAAASIGLIAWPPDLPAGSILHPSQATSGRSLVLATIGGLGFGVQLVVLHLASAQGSVLRALTLSRAGGTLAGAASMLLAVVRGKSLFAEPAFVGDQLAGALLQRRRAAGGAFLLLAALTGLLDTAGNGLYMGAALEGRLDVAAVLASLYPGATILLAVWLLHERTTRTQTVGMLLALVAVVLISL